MELFIAHSTRWSLKKQPCTATRIGPFFSNTRILWNGRVSSQTFEQILREICGNQAWGRCVMGRCAFLLCLVGIVIGSFMSEKGSSEVARTQRKVTAWL